MKYKFTGVENYQGLQQIVRISDGEIGGWIKSEESLSQEGKCFVYHNARVYQNAQVFGDAEIYNDAKIYGNAKVFDEANVGGDSQIHGDAKVYGHAGVWFGSEMFGNAIATKVVPFFSTGEYSVTITDFHIKIGCDQYLKTVFHKILPKILRRLQPEHAKFYTFICDYFKDK